MNFKNLEVKNYMMNLNDSPIVKTNQIMKEVIDQMDKHRLGIVNVLEDDNTLKGVITDGDLRRILLRDQKPLSAILVEDAIKYCVKNPLTIYENEFLIDSINLMNEKQIWDLPVVNKENKLIGLLHLHTAIKNYIEAQK